MRRNLARCWHLRRFQKILHLDIEQSAKLRIYLPRQKQSRFRRILTKMKTQILIEARSVYGHTNYYIVSEHRFAVAALTGKKTLDLRDVKSLEALGLVCTMVGAVAMPAVEAMV